ncbi:MAG: hypothetical protein QOE14_1010 [Humisphaera sp.]|nr:hypothetical protein [Humisphaera sp.]
MLVRLIICAIVLLLAPAVVADTVTMNSGRSIECVVLQENPASIVVRRGYGTMTIMRSDITKVAKAPAINAVAPAASTAPAETRRIPAWPAIVGKLVEQKWAANLQQIPATVIDVGVFKNVPYQSYRCGDDYEVNIYGDPDAPAGIEIGIYRELLKDPQAKENCVQLIATVLTDAADVAIVRAMNRKEDLIQRGSVKIEITPETSPDAYGGWWVSVYDEAALEKSRASDAELQQIAVARMAPASSTVRAAPRAAAPAAVREPVAQPRQASVAAAATAPTDPYESWSAADMRWARGSTSSAPISAGSGGSGYGRVYVRAYHRKDGTYVRGHTRRR